MEPRSTLRVAALVAGVLASACAPAQGSAGTSAPSIAAPSASLSPSGLPAGIKRSSLNPPTNAIFSPDGRYVVYGSGSTLTIIAIDGSLNVSTPASGWPRWLPDSSGLFVATSAPQRAGPLAFVGLDGKISALPLEFTNPMVSNDGTTIVAEHQEGCCMNIVQREIRVAQRSGGPARVLVTSSAPAAATQSIVLLGIDGQDRVLYRDDERIALIPLSGGPSAELAIPRGLVPPFVLADSVSPDRSVILLRTYEPTAEWMLFNGKLQPFPSEAGAIVRLGASKGVGASPLWLGAQTILVRTESGTLGSYDLARYTPGYGSNAMQTVLPYVDGDAVLAFGNGALLWRSGDHVHIITLDTHRDRDTGLVAPVRLAGAIAGGFLLIGDAGSYEISAP
ncbi:MAG: hypothetical protein QOF36_2407 [Microbacteriaceae bacterium]|nr:hypothetical protein [Microbacteriaceae bacterium]